MKIYNLKINDIIEPIGMMMNSTKFSFIIDEFHHLDTYIVNVYKNNEIVYHRDYYEYQNEILLDISLESRTRYDVELIVYSDFKKEIRKTFFITGKVNEPFLADWIGTPKKDNPVFERDFKTDKEIKSAYLHITSLGIFECFINNRRLGDEYLTPYLTEYRKEVELITYDVKEYLKKDNKLEVGIGPGWYMGHFGGPNGKEIYGNHLGLYLELHIEYVDSTKELILSDDNFKVRNNEIIFSDIYDGEAIDVNVSKDYYKPLRLHENINIINRVSLPIRIQEYLEVKDIIVTPKKEVVLDFGQNHTGFVEFDIEDSDNLIEIDHGEILQEGCFYNDNYRTAKAHLEIHPLKGKYHVYGHYTFYGYRYIRVKGIKDLSKCNFRSAVLYSDVKRSGYFNCDDNKINRLYLNSLWGLKSNFLDIPTDCPQRDERLGWTGDAQVFSHTALLHSDSKVFYQKFLRDLRTYQKELGGGVPSCIPEIFGNHDFTAVWGDAGCIIPMNLFDVYDDIDILKDNYDLMKDWVDYLDKLIKENNKENMLWNFGFQYGDWLALDGKDIMSSFGGTDTSFIASIYFYNSINLLIKSMTVLGIDSSYYVSLKDQVKNDILNTYFNGDSLKINTQTAHVISLRYGIYNNKDKIIESLRNLFKENNYYLKTGFVGTPLLLGTLADNGLEDISLKLLFNEEYPSWLYCVNLGATTIWERWNSVLPNGMISDTGMNSLNHYSYGSVASFMYEYLAGIKMVERGYKKVVFNPLYNFKINNIECAYDSCIGRFGISYHKINDNIVYVKIIKPTLAKADLIMPDGRIKEINNNYLEIIYKIVK